MLSFQEMLAKTEDQRRKLKRYLGSGNFHPNECSIFDGLKPADKAELKEAYKTYSLAEFLAKSSDTGIAGAAYMVPDKIHDTLIFGGRLTDKVPLISAYVAERWKGGDLNVDVVSDHTYKPKFYSSGGAMAVETMETVQPTISPLGFSLPIIIGGNLVEDAAWDMIQYHVQKAGQAMGDFATDMALKVLKTATDGVGTVNSATSATTDTTIWSEITTAIDAVSDDLWLPNTLIITPEAWFHNVNATIGGETAGGAAGDYWQFEQVAMATKQPAVGFDKHIHTLDVLFNTSPELHDSTDAVGDSFTTCVTLVYDRNNALLTGRKRWMRIENYGNPIADLAGAVVSCRQDSVTLYDDAIYVLTEST